MARTFGFFEDEAGTQATHWTRTYPEVHKALQHIANVCLQVPNVRAARLARGARRFGLWPDCSRSLLLWWWPRDLTNLHQMHLDGVRCTLVSLLGSDWQQARVMQFIMGDEPLLATDDVFDPEGAPEGNTPGAPGDDDGATDVGSPSGLSAIPEETESDISTLVHEHVLAAWQQIRDTEDLNEDLSSVEPDDYEQYVYAAIEHAAAGLGRRPHEWPQHLETMSQRQVIHEKCHYALRGASLDGYAEWEEEDATGKHVELYLDPCVRPAFLSTRPRGTALIARPPTVWLFSTCTPLLRQQS